MNPPDYKLNKGFADTFNEQIKKILHDNAMLLIEINLADEYSDTKQATDLVIKVNRGCVAARVRRNVIGFRDFTIRSYSRGYKTELQKLREGFADWYLYAWTDDNTVLEYLMIDMNILRAAGLLDREREEITNNDGGATRFIFIPLPELQAAKCVVRHWNAEYDTPSPNAITHGIVTQLDLFGGMGQFVGMDPRM